VRKVPSFKWGSIGSLVARPFHTTAVERKVLRRAALRRNVSHVYTPIAGVILALSCCCLNSSPVVHSAGDCEHPGYRRPHALLA